MELSWLTRIKVAVVLALGVIVWGVGIWHFIAIKDPMGAVTLSGNISVTHIAITIGIAFVVGFAAYFIGWPYGREIGILAVPAGLAAWAVRSGDMAELMRTHADVAWRQNLYRSLGWEGIVWFAIAAAGYGGVMAAAKLIPSSGVPAEIHPPTAKSKTVVRDIFALVAAVMVAAAGISMLAKDVVFNDKTLGVVLGQPANRQIAFAAMVSFGLAAFVVNRFWEASYIWPAIATVIVSCVAMNLAGSGKVPGYMASNWSANFFAQPAYAILPIQTISFGIIGSVTGYWLAVRFKYWQTHHAK
ncbi:MAG: hypothetical protein Q7T18_11945 [Sedimentisphaerales bacterium]|nr:hypothetical protein [Sedimentisphaerales bacterium]